MIITLDVPEGLLRRLSAEAAQLGLPLGEYIQRVLATGRNAGQTRKTGADLVAFGKAKG